MTSKEYKLSYTEWISINEEDIRIESAETGADREMDFDIEKELEIRYEDYFKNCKEGIENER
tara:strand:+ start:85 stop:270 length:186 start_codon:yes stop_codon:yes gene_type:complete